MLTLSEELFLLSLHERRSSLGLSPAQAFPYALAGALLVELILAGKIHLEDGKKVVVDNTSPTGDVQLDSLLEVFQIVKKARKITYWINVFGSKSKKLQKGLTTSLLAKNILKEEKKRFLWVIPYVEYTQLDASAKFWRKQHLRAIVLADDKADEQSIVLLSLLKACNLLSNIFTEDEIKLAKKQVDELVKDEAIGQAVGEIVDEITTAAAAAAMAAVSAP
jgi:hypothetical protein